MRNWLGVNAILWLPLLLASYASADEAADRVAIDRTIAALNESPLPAGVFTKGASSELGQLPDAPAFRISRPAGDLSRPTITISHEPWGEATISLPAESLNPRIVSDRTRLITPDVAVADGRWTYQEGATTRTIRLLFVMRKDSDGWKIATARVLAS